MKYLVLLDGMILNVWNNHKNILNKADLLSENKLSFTNLLLVNPTERAISFHNLWPRPPLQLKRLYYVVTITSFFVSPNIRFLVAIFVSQPT